MCMYAHGFCVRMHPPEVDVRCLPQSCPILPFLETGSFTELGTLSHQCSSAGIPDVHWCCSWLFHVDVGDPDMSLCLDGKHFTD